MKTAPRTKKSEHTHTVHIYKLYCSYTLMYTDVYRNFHKSKCKEVTMFTRKLLEIFTSHVISMTEYNALYNSFTIGCKISQKTVQCVSISIELKMQNLHKTSAITMRLNQIQLLNYPVNQIRLNQIQLFNYCSNLNTNRKKKHVNSKSHLSA